VITNRGDVREVVARRNGHLSQGIQAPADKRTIRPRIGVNNFGARSVAIPEPTALCLTSTSPRSAVVGDGTSAARQAGTKSSENGRRFKNSRAQASTMVTGLSNSSRSTALPHLPITLPTVFDIAASGFSVREARAADAAACRMLLPVLPADSRYWVAIDSQFHLVIGAAALTRLRRNEPLLGPGAMVHVIAPCRGVGVGAALRDQLQRSAIHDGSKAIYAAKRVEDDSDEMHGWQRLGFTVCETVEEHELPLAHFEPRLAPLVERFLRQGRIPADAHIVPLYSANRADVLQLHLDHMGGDRASLYQKINGQVEGSFHPRYSKVLMLGKRTVGCILGHRTSQFVMTVDATILAPEVRGGWGNVWLKLEATRGAMSLGITHFHFTSFEHYADTRRFTEKLGGATIRKWALMYRPL
jgi:hypothetical protein